MKVFLLYVPPKWNISFNIMQINTYNKRMINYDQINVMSILKIYKILLYTFHYILRYRHFLIKSWDIKFIN